MAGSAAIGAGMSPPFSPLVDAGPLASPAGGPPGMEDIAAAPARYTGQYLAPSLHGRATRKQRKRA